MGNTQRLIHGENTENCSVFAENQRDCDIKITKMLINANQLAMFSL